MTPRDTAALRQRVLRPHQSIEQLSSPRDDDPDTAVFAVREPQSGEVAATGSVRRESSPGDLADKADGAHAHWRLRGMATKEELRGNGLGHLVLDACVEQVRGRGGGVLWCSARVGAREFYARAGFPQAADAYAGADVGPHVLMYRNVEPS